MKFDTYGDPNNKSVLLIHTLFTNAEFFAPITDLLAENYYVITATLSGHYENSLYISTDDEIDQIERFLSDSGISSVYTVAGFSLGGIIAYNFFCKNAQTTEKAVIDSAPLFCFPKFIRKMFYNRYAKCLKKIESGNCDAAKELNKCFNGMGEHQKHVAPTVSFDSLKNLVESCFNNKIYRLNNEDKAKITFIYGTKDIARLCRCRLKNCNITKMKGYGHCGLYRENPVEWVKQFI